MPGPWDKYAAKPTTQPGQAVQPDAVQKNAAAPWEKYAQAPAAAAPQAQDFTANPKGEGTYKMQGPSGTVGVPYSQVFAARRSGYKLDSTDTARFTKDYVNAPVADSGPGVLTKMGQAAKGFGGELLGAAKGAASLFAPPQTQTEEDISNQTPAGLLTLPAMRMGKGIVRSERTAAGQVKQYAHDSQDPGAGVGQRMLSGLRAGTTALSMVNPLNPAGTAGLNDKIDQGKGAEAAGAGLADMGMLAAPEVLPRVGGAAKGFLAGDVDAPIAGTTTTPRARYLGAKELGVDLPPAQATNSGPLKMLDKVNREGFLSGSMHDRLQAKNIGALTDATDSTLRKMSPFEPAQRDAAGAKLQSLAKGTQEGMQQEAQDQYSDVHDKYGQMPVSNTKLITDTAKEIGEKNGRFSEQFPSLENKRMAGVIGDAAQLGNEGQLNFLGQPTISDLMRSRSALLDLTRDPEIVKSSYGGDIQRLIAAHDQAIMGSLPPEGQATWRDANGNWEGMKSTFDNPSNPFYHAVRTDTPSTLVNGIGGPSPEGVGALKRITGDEGTGIVQRGVAEDLLGTTKDGGYNFPKFAGRFERTPEAYRDALFGAEAGGKLRKIGSTADALTGDYNPSGTAKVGQKTLEAASLLQAPFHPLAAIPAALQYPLGRFMTSPAVSDWLMQGAAPTSPFVEPAGALAVASRKNRDQ